MSKHFTDLKVEKLPEAEAEVSGALTLEYLAECRPEALKSLGNAVNIPGFRKGNIPEDILVKHVGEIHVLEEVAEVALGREYSLIMAEAKLSPIGRPTISVTKLAPGVPLEWKIRVALEPEFTLPDYQQIAKEVMAEADELEVTDKELSDVLAEIQKKEVEVALKEGQTLESRIKDNMLEEKKFRAKEKKRLKLVEELVKKTEVAVPAVLINAELDRMLMQFKDDVQKMGVKFDDYLKELKKTEEEVKEEWKSQALIRVKAEMVVSKIAEAEKIEPTAEEVESEAKHVLSHHPDADPLRVRIYVFTMIRNQKVLEYLEGIK